MIHTHSIDARRSDAPKFSKRLKTIWCWLEGNGPATDREVTRALGYTECNACRPRITEGIAAGMLEEVGEKVCPVTGKKSASST